MEKVKTKKLDKQKLFTRIMAGILAFFMVLSIAMTVLGFLLG